jgi:hypothetical protein
MCSVRRPTSSGAVRAQRDTGYKIPRALPYRAIASTAATVVPAIVRHRNAMCVHLGLHVTTNRSVCLINASALEARRQSAHNVMCPIPHSVPLATQDFIRTSTIARVPSIRAIVAMERKRPAPHAPATTPPFVNHATSGLHYSKTYVQPMCVLAQTESPCGAQHAQQTERTYVSRAQVRRCCTHKRASLETFASVATAQPQ